MAVLVLAFGGLLAFKGTSRDEDRRPLDWTAAPPTQQLALARHVDGRWVPGPVPADDATLTVTLVVPWEEVGERYSGLNVVVR